MDSDLYCAAISGNIDFLWQNKDKVGNQVTKDKSSVLHLASELGKIECVQAILQMHPSLLCNANSTGDTALHLAAKGGHSNVVKALIDEAKKSSQPAPPYYYHQHDDDAEHGVNVVSLKEMVIRMVNMNNETALHEAARYNRVQVVSLLVNEDMSDSHTSNKDDETPLYIAAYRGHALVVDVICKICISPAYGGSDGRTVLHAAAISQRPRLVQNLLSWKAVLIKETDKYGWTALHYAAYSGCCEDAVSLMKVDKSVAYIADKTRNRTALHIAAIRGHIEVMKQIVQLCPDCFTMVDKKGRSVLHIALEHDRREMVEYICQNCPVIGRLLSQKNDQGNTPLHLVSITGCFVADIIKHEVADKEAMNNNNLTPLDSISYGSEVDRISLALAEKGLKEIDANRTSNLKRIINGREHFQQDDKFKELVERLKKMGETHMVVAALIATTAFAAGFTVPGGYDGDEGPNQGLTILTKKAAFQAFIISDTLALLLSTISLIMYLAAAMFLKWIDIAKFLVPTTALNILAIVAMMIAFISGTNAALPPASALAIIVCILGCSFFVILFFILKKIIRTDLICGFGLILICT